MFRTTGGILDFIFINEEVGDPIALLASYSTVSEINIECFMLQQLVYGSLLIHYALAVSASETHIYTYMCMYIVCICIYTLCV